MLDGLIIREAAQADVGFMYELMKSQLGPYFAKFSYEGWSRAHFKDKLKLGRIKVLEHENMPIGFYEYELRDFFYIHDICLSEDYQHKGIGSHILNLFEGISAQNRISELRGKVFKTNTSSLNWLRRRGFLTTGEIIGEYSFWVSKLL